DRRQWRRGVYVHWQRQFLHPMMKAFDAPSREECSASRPRSNTPTAALSLLNDPTFVEAARVFAERLLSEWPADSRNERLTRAIEWALSRSPTEEEQVLLTDYFEKQSAAYKEDRKSALALAGEGTFPRNEKLDPVEVAAWAGVTRTLLNLNETITKN
ncbi:MAG: DUF1553 domain-containing protein, partial [Verrucomicrobiota bacterium]